jgi:hypothetical protein
MQIEEFSAFATYFRLQLDADADYLDAWRKPLEAYTLLETRNAILVLNANRGPLDVTPSGFLPKLIEILKAARRAKIFRQERPEAGGEEQEVRPSAFSLAEAQRRVIDGKSRGVPADQTLAEYRRELSEGEGTYILGTPEVTV